ncbi:MAG: hypothetical protein J6R59_00680 [Paludibacteraceae bacterium]|nr:hypothetical protein [Paludibacteraceae bacterium]
MFETVNSVRSISTLDNNALFFNLFVPSKFIYDNKATIKLPLDDVQTGWYNFNIYVDLESAIFELKINDEIYEVIKDGKHYKNSNGTLVVDDEIDMSWFKPYISANDTIFNTTYYVGVVGKKYGTILNNVLKNGAEDPYISKNTKIENVHLYTKKLNFHQYQAMRMRGTKINKLILTLPCGNRNCIDEMIRYFKYVATQSVSNNIKITIAGTGLQTEG